MNCVETVSYSFLLNGEPRDLLHPGRGLRQGDSISRYLFLLCAEALSRLSWSPRNKTDCMELLAEEEECLELREILLSYAKASGQQINFEKSCVSFSRNVDLVWQLELADCLGVVRVDKHDKYLGLPTELSYSKDEAFRFLTEKIEKRTQGWRDKTLSVAGKEIMIKTVLQSIPNYVMKVFELPRHLCHAMHQLMAKFWWGDQGDVKKIHWLAWDRLCCPNNEGGLGFRNMVQFNHALLAKQARMEIDSET
ncbi:uncharacterized protein LOC112171051 [Rosa chinensis]|uniref:uncharacterized protein LOC112171051 n=1 Tax=Rosa chinensis TaxID=74649 RepID=UPI000D0872BB|nr:uncharacterized protein LOC112171051 [Rosa chinensis]